MQNQTPRLPVVSLVLVVASIFASLMGPFLFRQMGNAGTLTALILALGCALLGVLLGLIGFISNRRSPSMSRAPAVIGMILGAMLAIFYAAVLFLVLTPNAPF